MQWPTHEVTNQVPELQDYNIFTSDTALVEGVQKGQAGWHAERLTKVGAELGTPEVIRLGELANRHLPELATHDRQGRRVDQVEFHPSWHALLDLVRRERLQSLPWMEEKPGAQVARAAAYFMQTQVESGTLCPTTMTFASIPVLQNEPALFAQLKDKLYSDRHDPRDLPIEQKHSIMIGMGMTEKQGGSDVRTNTTQAKPLTGQGRGAAYALTGHKWFFSAPMCDAHLVLARTDANNGTGVSCFFVPRWRPDGTKNTVLIQRLKDKLGNCSNSSSEVEFQDAYGIMVGEEGRGIPTIIEMANHTRLDCVIGSSALMRQAFVQAAHHARHRSAFGKKLIEQPMMTNVLADLALESEAATLLMLRLARAFESDDPLSRAWRRMVTPAAKFWICKRALEFTGECMEVWGGNGYVETGPMSRLYREAPVNSIWEGSGNVMCLDVLRAMERSPESLALLLDELGQASSDHAALKQLLDGLRQSLSTPPEQRESLARRFTQRLALAAQASLMLQHAPSASAEAFIASRLDAENGRVYGTLAADASAQQAILKRAWPLQ
ncbi:MAG: isovaleryl-CoA dehydrogenase [Burkholderiaceae bacterium]|nr:isovaleryl-CoA dehydrogenase [Burkholderiaceae bacterium]